MRSRVPSLIAAIALSSAAVSAADALAWIRADGSPGWSATLPSTVQPDANSSPLTAPVWFARFPNVKIALTPTGSLDVASVRGKVLLIDYWASWCGPCLQELPHLQKLHLEKEKAGLLTIAVNADEPAQSAADSAKRLGLTMPIGLNEAEVYRALGVRTLPTLLLVDKAGRLRKRWDGYRPGLEREIAQTVDKLLADDPSGSSREIARVVGGTAKLNALWIRDLNGSADGIVGLPSGAAGGMRVVASGGNELISFDADGEALARLMIEDGAGRLRDFGAAADGTRELVAYRPGGTSVRVLELRSGGVRTITLPAPLIDFALAGPSQGDGRRIAFATLNGAAEAGAREPKAALKEGTSAVRSLSEAPGGAVLALRENGAIGTLDGSSPAWSKPATGATRLLRATASGALVGPQSVIAAVSGRFLPEGRQIAVATHAGHVVMLDDTSGKVVFDAVWGGVHDLSATDLNGDGRDELLVAFGRSITALGAAAR